MNKVLKVKCPTCKDEFNYYHSEFRPFCCERCKQIDLGQWFQETYTIEGKPVQKQPDDNEFVLEDNFFNDQMH